MQISAKFPDGLRRVVVDLGESAQPHEAVTVFKNGNPELTNWQIDGNPIVLVNSETGERDE